VIQVRKVVELLVIAPPILGMLAYDFLTHTMAGMVLIGVLRKYLGIVLPGPKGIDLVQLLTPSTFFNAETLLSENTRSWSAVRVVWILAITVSFFLTGLLAVLHSIYLLWRSGVWHPLTVLASAGVALMFAFMPLILFPRNFPSKDARAQVTETK
jgi:hypothetical protein